MTNPIKHLLLSVVLLGCLMAAGCSSPYMVDRGRDATDMFTLAVERAVLNASVQVSRTVIGVGLAEGNGYGLRSGALGVYEFSEVNLFFYANKQFIPNQYDMDRNKGYLMHHYFNPFDPIGKDVPRSSLEEGSCCNWWQIEATAGLGVGIRAGVNVAEILDFILGWTTLDICQDDIRWIEEKSHIKLKKEKKADSIRYKSLQERISQYLSSQGVARSIQDVKVFPAAPTEYNFWVVNLESLVKDNEPLELGIHEDVKTRELSIGGDQRKRLNEWIGRGN